MLSLHARLIELRRRESALEIGPFEFVEASAPGVLAYRRGAFLVALNLGPAPRQMPLVRGGTVALSTHLDRAGERLHATLELRPDEGVIVRLA